MEKSFITREMILGIHQLAKYLSENQMEIISDALQCYGMHPEDHTYDEELEDIRKLALIFHMEGYDKVYPEYNILTGWNG